MKAPDKIYLAFKDGFVAQSANTDKDGDGNSIFLPEYEPHEYIHKDTLMEFLYRRITIWEDKYVRRAMEEVIDKINSLWYASENLRMSIQNSEMVGWLQVTSIRVAI